jgi:DNA integrity scanning protein DisA with diadenylate cyclase activity
VNFLEFPFPRITYKDILEIFIIAFFFYQLLLLIRGTRAIQILQGEGEEEVSSMVDEIVDACFHMSRKKVGAIIVIERDIGLEEFMETGTQLNAAISSRLLQTIFFHNSPLHDGAVIIKENRVHSAACYLPLTENVDIDKDLGTRHRAAIGITEHTDCISIVVSEETGSVSVCTNGRLKFNMSMKSLSHHLRALCNPKKRIEKRFLFFPVIKQFAVEPETIKDLKAKIARTSLLKGKLIPPRDTKVYDGPTTTSITEKFEKLDKEFIEPVENLDTVEEFIESDNMEMAERDYSDDFITVPLPEMEEPEEESLSEEKDNSEYQKDMDISGVKQD